MEETDAVYTPLHISVLEASFARCGHDMLVIRHPLWHVYTNMYEPRWQGTLVYPIPR